MLKTSRLLSLIIIFFLSFEVFGQKNTISPYSRYGIGELSSNAVGFSKAMGGTGIGMRVANQLNFMNPASYTSQDTLSFLFDFGISGKFSNYETNNQSAKIKSAEFTHLALSFPITHWAYICLGFAPYSSVGYNINKSYSPFTDLTNSSLNSYNFTYANEGSGELSRYFLGAGFKFKNLSVGINGYYMLGNLQYKNSVLPADPYAFSTVTTSSLIVNDIYMGLGAQYSISINEKTNLVIGAVWDLKTNLKAHRDKFVEEQYANVSDTAFFEEGAKASLSLPAKVGLGASISFNKKITLAFDYSTRDWTKFQSPVGDEVNSSVELKKVNSVNFGVLYMPNYKAIRGYLNRVSYCVGAHFSNSYITYNGQNLLDKGISIGVGLPFKGTNSMAHINYEYGSFGTLNNNLVREKYQYISFSLSLYDFWFFKRKEN